MADTQVSAFVAYNQAKSKKKTKKKDQNVSDNHSRTKSSSTILFRFKWDFSQTKTWKLAKSKFDSWLLNNLFRSSVWPSELIHVSKGLSPESGCKYIKVDCLHRGNSTVWFDL